jgi:hypothetical protein
MMDARGPRGMRAEALYVYRFEFLRLAVSAKVVDSMGQHHSDDFAITRTIELNESWFALVVGDFQAVRVDLNVKYLVQPKIEGLRVAAEDDTFAREHQRPPNRYRLAFLRGCSHRLG